MSNAEELHEFTVSSSGHIVNENLLFEILFKLPSGKFFTNRFVPHVNENLLHHVVLLSCKHPKTNSNNPNDIFMAKMVCDEGPDKMGIYGWNKGGKENQLMSDTAYELGEDFGIPYIVMEMHYKPNSINQTDNSSVTIYWSEKPTKYNAGIFTLDKEKAIIPPKRGHFPIDVFCKYTGNATLYPFAFYPHTHSLGRSFVGLWMSSNGKQMIEFARAHPLWPDKFLPIKSKFTIETGDYLIARCIFDSTNKSVETIIGPESDTREMCSLYITYSVERNKVKSKPYDDIPCKDEQPPLSFQLPNDTLDYMPDKVPPNYFPSEFLRSSIIE